MPNSNIIALPVPRRVALDKFGVKLVAHMSMLFYKHGLYHIPVLNMVRAVIDTMMHDRVDYSDEILSDIIEDPDAILQIEDTFVMALIEQKLIATDFR